MNFRILQPQVIISINHCPALSYIRVEGNDILCGALTRQAEAERSKIVHDNCSLLSEALPLVGGLANRNRGTVCGSLAHADPLAELPAVAVALDAKFLINGAQGRRQVPADAFFVSELATCLAPNEMLEAVRIPCRPKTAQGIFLEVGNRRHGFAVAGIAAEIDLDVDGRCRSARLAVIGAGPAPMRLRAAERLLIGQKISSELVRDVAAEARRDVDPPTDIHADSDYRRHLVGVLTARAIEKGAANLDRDRSPR